MRRDEFLQRLNMITKALENIDVRGKYNCGTMSGVITALEELSSDLQHCLIYDGRDEKNESNQKEQGAEAV